METPDYYLPVMPYITLKNARSFLDFAKKVFNAEEKLIVPREDGSIMHAEIAIGKAIIMFAEATAVYSPFPCSMFILVENVDALYHSGLANGAESLQLPENRDYGRSAGFKDSFGNYWWLTQPN